MASPAGIFQTVVQSMLGQRQQRQGQQALDQKQQEIDIQKAEEDRAARNADFEFAQHMQSLGAKPIFHGLVQDQGQDDEGNPTTIYRQPNPDRLKTSQKTASGDPIQWEVPNEQEQTLHQSIMRKMGYDQDAPLRTEQTQQAQATSQAEESGKLQGQNDIRTKYGVPASSMYTPEMLERMGISGDYKALPSELIGMAGRTIPAVIRGDTSTNNTAANNATKLTVASGNNADKDKRAADRVQFEKDKATRDEALKDAISQRSTAVQAGLSPNLAPIKLRQFQQGATQAQGTLQQADDEQLRLHQAGDILDPQTTPDGAKFQDPWTGTPKTMTPDLRSTIQDFVGARQKYVQILRDGAQRQLDDLGVKIPKASSGTGQPAQGGGGQAAGGGAPATPQGGASPALSPEAADAQDILNHRLSPSQWISQIGGRGMQKTARVDRVKAEIRKVDPAFNMEDAEASYQLTRSAGFQNTVRYMDSVQNSIPQLQQSADTLANGNVKSINALVNAGKNQFNSVDLKRFQADKLLVGDEIAKILQGGGTGSGTSDAKLKQAQDLLSTNDSPEAISTALKEVTKLIGYRRDSLTRGTPLAGQSQAPKTYKKTATGPGGHKIGSDDGQNWVDLQTGKPVQ